MNHKALEDWQEMHYQSSVYTLADLEISLFLYFCHVVVNMIQIKESYIYQLYTACI